MTKETYNGSVQETDTDVFTTLLQLFNCEFQNYIIMVTGK